MLSSKTTGWMLVMGLVSLVFSIVGQSMQDDGTEAEVVVWAAANEADLQIIVPIAVISAVFMLIFTVGFISWARSISESNGALAVGKYGASAALILIWVGGLTQLAGFELAAENADGAHALINLSRFGMWMGILTFLASFFVVGTTAFMKKSGTAVLNGLLAVVGLVGCVGGIIPMGMNWAFWVLGFIMALLLMAIIGVQKVVRGAG